MSEFIVLLILVSYHSYQEGLMDTKRSTRIQATFILILVFILLSVLALLQFPKKSVVLPVEQGKVVIPSLEEPRMYALDGQWKLQQPGLPEQYKTVPAVAWKQGTGTYTLNLEWKGENAKSFELYTVNVGTSGLFSVNGKSIGRAGVYGDNPETAVPTARPRVFLFDLQPGENELSIEISNFVHPRAGLWEHVYIGEAPALSEWTAQRMAFDFFMFGQILLFGMLEAFVTLFSSRRKYYGWFALGAIMGAFGGLMRNSFAIYTLLPNIDYLVLKRLQIVVYYLASGFFIHSFTSRMHSKVMIFAARLFLFFSVGMSFLNFLFPYAAIYYWAIAFFPLMGFFLLYRVYIQLEILPISWKSMSKTNLLLPMVADLVILYSLLHDFINLLLARYEYQTLPVDIYLYTAMYTIVIAKRYIEVNKQTEEAKNTIISTAEQEKKRLAGDLHDGVGQILHGLEFLSEAVLQAPSVNPEVLKKIRDTSAAAVKNLSQTINDLNPIRYGDTTLDISLKAMALNIQTTYQIAVDCIIEGEEIPLDGRIAMQLHYFYSEALKNAVNHAKSSRIDLYLAIEQTRIIGSIVNDGVTQTPVLTGVQGHGITIMRYRIEQLNGIFSIDAVEGNRVKVEFQIPRRGE